MIVKHVIVKNSETLIQTLQNAYVKSIILKKINHVLRF